MVKTRGILNTRKSSVLAQELEQSYIKSKLQFFLLSVCGAMMRFSSRNTSLWRHNDDWDGVCTINHRNHRILYRKLIQNYDHFFPEVLFWCQIWTYLWRHNSSNMEWKKKNKTKQLTGSLSTFVPTEFRHIPCFLLLSMPYDSRF